MCVLAGTRRTYTRSRSATRCSPRTRTCASSMRSASFVTCATSRFLFPFSSIVFSIFIQLPRWLSINPDDHLQAVQCWLQHRASCQKTVSALKNVMYVFYCLGVYSLDGCLLCSSLPPFVSYFVSFPLSFRRLFLPLSVMYSTALPSPFFYPSIHPSHPPTSANMPPDAAGPSNSASAPNSIPTSAQNGDDRKSWPGAHHQHSASGPNSNAHPHSPPHPSSAHPSASTHRPAPPHPPINIAGGNPNTSNTHPGSAPTHLPLPSDPHLLLDLSPANYAAPHESRRRNAEQVGGFFALFLFRWLTP
jgi:hypothetical protein